MISAGFEAREIGKPSDIENSDLVVLPGVGNFGHAISRLIRMDLYDALRKIDIRRQPVLGICLGMQILGLGSEESPNVEGLSLLQMESKRLVPKPIIGWRHLGGYLPGAYFHNHVYGATIAPKVDHTVFDDGGFLSLVISNKLVGVQFHPEKSQELGVELIRKLSLEVWNYK